MGRALFQAHRRRYRGARNDGIPIIWVGLPAVRGAKSTTDMALDELCAPDTDKAGIAYVDIWDEFVDDQGRYVQDGPDFKGLTRRLRTYDGVYFTKAGAEKLGHYVEHDLRRVLSSRVLPSPFCRTPEPVTCQRCCRSGPASKCDRREKSDKLWAPRPKAAHRDGKPIRSPRVLNRGEAVVARRGWADDFSSATC